MKIYLAGKISDSNTLLFLDNIKTGISYSAYLIKNGNDVCCSFLDYQFRFFANLTKEDFQRNSMSFLEGWADEIWVLPDWENSEGTKKEIARANELKIPVRYL